MRPVLCFLCALTLFPLCTYAQPSFHLAGDWKGEIISAYNLQEGLSQGQSCLFSIKEEQNGVFYGHRICHKESSRQSWEFAGIFNPNSKAVQITEANGNIFLGTVLTPNEIELHQLQTNKTPGAAYYVLHRAD